MSVVVGVLVVCVAAATGCISTASYHTAQPVEEGESEIGIAVEGNAVVADEVVFAFNQPRVHARRGMTENMDIGVAAGDFGFAADLNYLLFDTEVFAFSISPYQGLHRQGTQAETEGSFFTVLTSFIGAHFDFKPTDDFTATGAVKPGAITSFGMLPGMQERATGFTPMVAGSLGARIDFENVFLFPEVNFLLPIYVDDDLQVLLDERQLAESTVAPIRFGIALGF